MAKQKHKNSSPNKAKTNDQKSEWNIYSILKFFFIATTGLQTFWIFSIYFLAFFLWFGHYAYLFNLFENDRFFSHLSDVEREVIFELYLLFNQFLDVFPN
jgi:hypothetical protein